MEGDTVYNDEKGFEEYVSNSLDRSWMFMQNKLWYISMQIST